MIGKALILVVLGCGIFRGQTPFSITPTAPDQRVTFDVVSIHPTATGARIGMLGFRSRNGFRAGNVPLLQIIVRAYNPPNLALTKVGFESILNVPDWAKKERYDVEARVSISDVSAWQAQGSESKLLQSALRAMLADRCKLVTHHVTVDTPVYALEVAKSGPKLKEAETDEKLPPRAVSLPSDGWIIPYKRGEEPKVTLLKMSMDSFAAFLSGLGYDRTIVNRTGLSGIYDFELQRMDGVSESASDPSLPARWVVEPLGLKLVPMTAPLDRVVIDHIEKPSEN